MKQKLNFLCVFQLYARIRCFNIWSLNFVFPFKYHIWSLLILCFLVFTQPLCKLCHTFKSIQPGFKSKSFSFQMIVFLLYHPEMPRNIAPIIIHLFVQPIRVCQISGHPWNLFSTKRYSCWILIIHIMSVCMCTCICMYVHALLLRTNCKWTTFICWMDTSVPLSLLMLTIIPWGRCCQDVIPIL